MHVMNQYHFGAYTNEEFMRYADQDNPQVVELCRRLQEKTHIELVTDALEAEIDDLKSDLADANEKLEETQHDLSEAQDKIRKLETDNQELEEQLSKLASK